MRGLSRAGGTHCPGYRGTWSQSAPAFQENHQHMTHCSFGGGGCISAALAACAHVCQSLNRLQTSSECLLSAATTGPLFQLRRLHNNVAQSEGMIQPFIMLSDSVGQELRRGTAWKACLCSRMSGPLLENSKGWARSHPGTHSLHSLVVGVGWQLGPRFLSVCTHRVGPWGVRHSVVSGCYRASVPQREI